jgi:hypothetical protein
LQRPLSGSLPRWPQQPAGAGRLAKGGEGDVYPLASYLNGLIDSGYPTIGLSRLYEFDLEDFDGAESIMEMVFGEEVGLSFEPSEELAS